MGAERYAMVIRLADSLASVGRERWNGLLADAPTNTVFQTYEWHAAWWETFGGTQQLFLACADTGTGLAGIAPLMIARDARGARVLRFIGHGDADYTDFLYARTDPGILAEVLAFIRRHRGAWDRAELRHVPDGSPTVRSLLSESRRHALYSLRTETTPCPALVLRHPDRDAVARHLNKSSLRRHVKAFRKLPTYRVAHLEKEAELRPYLEDFFEQHVERWRDTPTPSRFVASDVRDFYRRLVSEMNGLAWVRFTALLVGDTMVASHFGFTYRNAFLWYKPAFAVEWARQSPGEALLKELLDHADAAAFDEFDFTVGAEEFKRRFSNVVRENATVVLYHRARPYYAHRLALEVKERLKRHPAGRKLLSAVKTLARRA